MYTHIPIYFLCTYTTYLWRDTQKHDDFDRVIFYSYHIVLFKFWEWGWGREKLIPSWWKWIILVDNYEFWQYVKIKLCSYYKNIHGCVQICIKMFTEALFIIIKKLNSKYQNSYLSIMEHCAGIKNYV